MCLCVWASLWGFITNPQMVFSQWSISCWHLDKCLPSRADLPFRLDQEWTRQPTATLRICFVTHHRSVPLFHVSHILNKTLTESKWVHFTWSQQWDTLCRCYTWLGVWPFLRLPLCAEQVAKPLTVAPGASNPQTAWVPAPPCCSPEHKRASANNAGHLCDVLSVTNDSTNPYTQLKLLDFEVKCNCKLCLLFLHTHIWQNIHTMKPLLFKFCRYSDNSSVGDNKKIHRISLKQIKKKFRIVYLHDFTNNMLWGSLF